MTVIQKITLLIYQTISHSKMMKKVKIRQMLFGTMSKMVNK